MARCFKCGKEEPMLKSKSAEVEESGKKTTRSVALCSKCFDEDSNKSK